MNSVIYIDEKPLDELLQLFNCDISDDIDFYTVIAYSIGISDINYLIKNITQFNRNQLIGIIFAFSHISEPAKKIESILDSLVATDNPTILDDSMILSAVIRVLRLRGKQGRWDNIQKYLYHNSIYIRGACLEYAAFSLPVDISMELLIFGLDDKDAIVREVAMDEILDLTIEENFPEKWLSKIINKFRDLLTDNDEYIRGYAQSSLESLTKENLAR
ncbi:hypothetical protein [Candidatus Albibeggiatoa sp. nov. BB20]|uniref:hypothetical protein n=1 Tax=Candidatus Albibeggiatoa sp. nov. BB20 TaxID=3162723 RepID=UPI003365725F